MKGFKEVPLVLDVEGHELLNEVKAEEYVKNGARKTFDELIRMMAEQQLAVIDSLLRKLDKSKKVAAR